MGRASSSNGGITRRAFHEFDRWAQRFGDTVRQRARALATGKSTRGVITSDILAEAVREACEQFVSELKSPHGESNSNEREDKQAA